MSPVPITSLYAALLALLFVALSARVIGRRRVARIVIGTGRDRTLERAARVHANFAEYAPLGLILMALAELAATTPWLIHAAGIVLLAGRLVHAWGVSQTEENLRLRMIAMVCTFTVLSGLALLLLVQSVVRAFGS